MTLSSLKGKEVEVNGMLKMEDRIPCVAAFACYVCALTACGAAAYALIALSRAAYGGLGQVFYLTASQL